MGRSVSRLQLRATPNREARAEASLRLRLELQVFAPSAHSGFSGSLTCPYHPEQKAKCQRQPQCRIGPLLQGLVDRIGYIVADFADRLDCFSSLVLGVRDDTSDVRTRRHG